MPEIDWGALWDHAWLAIAAFATGSVVTNLKALIELWRTFFPPKRRIVVQATLVGHPDVGGNVITMTNLSDRVALLSHWEIVRRRRGWLFHRDEHVADSDEAASRRIEPDTEIRLIFDGEHWFNPWRKDRPGRQIVFRYVITGDKPKEVVLTKG